MKPSARLLICLALGSALVMAFPARERWITLPNGFVLKGNSLLSSDFRSVLASDIEFVCFDDRFLEVISEMRGQSGLFDAETQNRVSRELHPEIFQPSGLKFGRRSCNGYYTWMLGPELLVAGNRPPFLPGCESVNRENTALKDKAWLERPCTDD